MCGAIALRNLIHGDEKMSAPDKTPETFAVHDRVTYRRYEGYDQVYVVAGIVAEVYAAPLTGRPWIRVVDAADDLSDPDAGRRIPASYAAPEA